MKEGVSDRRGWRRKERRKEEEGIMKKKRTWEGIGKDGGNDEGEKR